MTKRESAYVVAAAVEALLLTYGAAASYVTPSTSDPHNLRLAGIFVGIATPVVGYVMAVVVNAARVTGPALVLAMCANGALLLLCLSGTLSGGASYAILPALVACSAFCMIVAALRLDRRGLRERGHTVQT